MGRLENRSIEVLGSIFGQKNSLGVWLNGSESCEDSSNENEWKKSWFTGFFYFQISLIIFQLLGIFWSRSKFSLGELENSCGYFNRSCTIPEGKIRKLCHEPQHRKIGKVQIGGERVCSTIIQVKIDRNFKQGFKSEINTCNPLGSRS